MPPTKKRRVNEDGTCEDVQQLETPIVKRRRKGIQYDPGEICQEIYDAVRNHKTEDGRLLCENFVRVPKRRNEPEYYDVVSNPIDLMKVQNKLKNEEYDEVDQMTDDINLIVSNSKKYYKEGTQQYSDAVLLTRLYDQVKTMVLARILGDDLTPEPTSNLESTAATSSHYAPDVLANMDESTNDMVEGDDEEEEDDLEDVKHSGMEVSSEQRPRKKRRRRAREVIAETSIGEDDRMILRIRTDKSGKPHRMSLRDKEPQDFRSLIFSRGRGRPPKEDSVSREERDKEDQASSVTDDESVPYEDLLTAIVTAREGDRVICEMFKVLPNREILPGYYDVITEPMDLKTIAQKIQRNEYTSTDEMFKDLMLMVNNAKSFNEPGSQIYKDAGALRKLIVEKKIEMSQSRPTRSTRLRTRRGHKEKMSSVIASLEYTVNPVVTETLVDTASMAADTAEEASETEGSTVDDTEMRSPLWSLYYTVKKYRDQVGQVLSEPFLRLPNRRFYPDYYEEISMPTTLPKIKKKLRDGQYKSLDKLYSALDVMFENAKRYNLEGSKIHSDAVKLQGVMRTKYKELASKEEIFGDSSDIVLKKSRRSFETASVTSEEGGATPKRRPGRKPATEDVLKRRLWALYKTVSDYQFDGRRLVDIFMTLPSKKDYPNYYQVISEPIDMKIIESKIKENKYTSDHTLVQDIELMLNNARNYNEESSQIYKDAETLERILRAKVKSLPPLDGSPLCAGKDGRIFTAYQANPQVQRFHDLYNYIKDYSDSKGRVLSTPFIKLPPKQDYPDYYEIIKKPVDMTRISQKISSGQYASLEDMVSDFVQIFDNACKYNEPDSVIYKDALTLQRACLEKKQELLMLDDGCGVPDVRALVQEMMTNLFISTYNHVDEEGRCYSDSFLELPAAVEVEVSVDGQTQNPKKRPSFQQVKRNLDRGRYRRMDRFQQDMIEVFEYARRVSQSDSQLYEDAVELQLFFLRLRDEICGNGEVLLTFALNYTEEMCVAAVDVERKEKQEKEQEEDEKRRVREESNEKEQIDQDKGEDSYTYNGHTYRRGDFVTIEPREPSLQYHVVLIERFIRDDKGETCIHGNFFLQPQETFHLATKKFLQKEVFKSDKYETFPFSKVTGICYVMSVKEYFKLRPEGIPESEVFICESRYICRLRLFKKIKVWPVPRNGSVELVTREVPLVPVRVASVFAEKSDVSDSESEELSVMDTQRQVVVAENLHGSEDGNVYYEQFQVAAGWFKIGDFAYVQQMGVKTVITRIDRMWCNSAGDAFIYGPTYVHPFETEHEPTRTFYQREVFQTAYEDTHWMDNILGRCTAMSHKDFVSCRPTEIQEKDIYLCEAKYIEAERQIKKFLKPASVINQNNAKRVCLDEILFFKKQIMPQKVPSPLLLDMQQQSFGMDDSAMGYDENSSQLDGSYTEGFNLSVGFGGLDVPEQTSVAPTPEPEVPKSRRKGARKEKGEKAPRKEKRKIKKKGNVSGYIMFAAEFRKDVAQSNKELSFGAVSKIVGQRWKMLEKKDKEIYEALAVKKQAELKAKHAAAELLLKEAAAKQAAATAASESSQTPKKQVLQYTAQSPSGFSQNSNSAHGYPSSSGYQQAQQSGVSPQMQYIQQAGQQYIQTTPSGMRMTSGMYGGGQSRQATPTTPQQNMLPSSGVTTTTQQLHGMSHLTPAVTPTQQLHGMSHLTPAVTPTQPSTTPSQTHTTLNGVGQQGVMMISSQSPQQQQLQQQQTQQQFQQQMGPPAAPTRPPSPMFVSVPPRTQRLLHSEAYLKYIENLRPDRQEVSNWRKQLSATEENTPLSGNGKLPIHWLGNGVGHHENAASALWALRDLMLKDTLEISRTLDYSEIF